MSDEVAIDLSRLASERTSAAVRSVLDVANALYEMRDEIKDSA